MKRRRKTRQRQIVLDAVCARRDHPNASQIYSDVRAVDDKISRATVYRNLNLLVDSGYLVNVKALNVERFDNRLDFHYHFVCTKCGALYDVPLPYSLQVDRTVAEQIGCEVTRHRTVFEGLCSQCGSLDK